LFERFVLILPFRARELKQGKEVKILTDQYVSPTLNTNLAETLIEIAEKKSSEHYTQPEPPEPADTNSH